MNLKMEKHTSTEGCRKEIRTIIMASSVRIRAKCGLFKILCIYLADRRYRDEEKEKPYHISVETLFVEWPTPLETSGHP